MPGLTAMQTSCWLPGDHICILCNCVSFIISSASISHIVFISVDRYVAICDPMHYTTKITVRRVQLCVCLCWLYSVLYGIFCVKDIIIQPGKYMSCECVMTNEYIPGLIDLVLSFIVPVSLIIILYMRVFVVAVSQARSMRSHVAAVTLQVSLTLTSNKSEVKAAKTLSVLVVVFLICYCPYYCVSLAGIQSSNSSAFIVLYVFYFNSCLNPVIYALFYPWFRKAVKLIMTLQILQPWSRDANIL